MSTRQKGRREIPARLPIPRAQAHAQALDGLLILADVVGAVHAACQEQGEYQHGLHLPDQQDDDDQEQPAATAIPEPTGTAGVIAEATAAEKQQDQEGR